MTPQEIYSQFQKGASYSQIGEMIGKSRSSIAGIISRYRGRINKPARIVAPEVITPPKRLKKPKAKYSFADLPNHACRFPEGELWCGHETEEKRSYCPYHMQVAYTKYLTKQERGKNAQV